MDQYCKDRVYTERASKVPEVTLGFWVVKILATTLGETGGDAVTMSMNLGYLAGTAIFAAIFAVAVAEQIRANRFHPFLYWMVIVATTTVGTTLADFVDRSLGIGYLGGSSLLAALLIASLMTWHRTLGTVSIDSINSNQAEIFYWITILFSQTLGTALGDWPIFDGLKKTGMPMIGRLGGVPARTKSGPITWVAAALPRMVMKSRRLMLSPKEACRVQ